MSDARSENAKRLDDARVYLAVERTFLAWIRTGLAMMGFGFVLARFGLFFQQFRPDQKQTSSMPGRFGTALVMLGVLLTVAALVRYVRLLRRLERGQPLTKPSRMALAMGIALALIGILISGYLMTT